MEKTCKSSENSISENNNIEGTTGTIQFCNPSKYGFSDTMLRMLNELKEIEQVIIKHEKLKE